MKRLMLVVPFLLLSCAGPDWEPADLRLATRWSDEVSSESPRPEYPRPMMRRDDWRNLNGLWDYAVVERDAEPEEYDGKILVPFAIESSLSGVAARVGESKSLWYRRSFEVPDEWEGKRVLLHFEAVDWDATVIVNDHTVTRHRGGYDPFTVDITDYLYEGGEQELVVSVWDPTDAGSQPRGKQVSEPGGIFYTPVTGIWQTVWLEPVPEMSIEGLQTTPDIDRDRITISVRTQGATETDVVTATVSAAGTAVATASSEPSTSSSEYQG